MARLCRLLLTTMTLSGCAAIVDYGNVPHSQLSAGNQCGTSPNGNPAAVGAGPSTLFVVTSRLPDCRLADVVLTNFRSPRVRFGRLAAADMLPSDASHKVTPQVTFQAEEAWWSDLEGQASANGGRVLVYVHGYRETFASSTRDSFQIQRLTAFSGPVVQYSWPSQGKLSGYLVDETNVYWDERNFRRFLSKLATQPWTKDIVLVSHSMGARLVLPAVEFVDRTSSDADASNISNIILASPDIDREDFERDIAEEVLAARRVNNNRRITIYVSRKDKALAISRTLHGYPRLGSPYCFDPFEAAALKAKGVPGRCYAAKSSYDVPPEKSGLTIIDTTEVSRKSSGHSDFLSSAPACLDFKAVAGGEIDRTAGRVPTRLSYVFTLQPFADPSDAATRAACQLPPK